MIFEGDEHSRQRDLARTAFTAEDELVRAFRLGGKGNEGVNLENWKVKETWTQRDRIIAEVRRRRLG